MKKKALLLTLVLALALSMVSFAGAQDGESRTQITTDNAANLQVLQRISRGSAEHAQFTPDGGTVLVGGTIGIWQYDAANLGTEEEPPLLPFTGEIVDFALSPDGSLLVTYDNELGELELYNYPSMELIGTYNPEVSPTRLSFSPDNTLVAVNGGSRGIEVVSAEDGSLVVALSASLESDVPVIFSPDSSQVAASLRGSLVHIWNIADGPEGEPLVLEGAPDTVRDMTFTADGSQLIGTTDGVIGWNVADGTEAFRVETNAEGGDLRDIQALAISPDGSQLYTGESSIVRIWNLADGSEQTTIELENGAIDQIDFAPDGSTFMVRISNQVTPVMLFNTADNTMVASVQGHNSSVDAPAFSPDSATLAFGDSDGFLYLWDTATAGEITTATKVTDGTTFGINNIDNIIFSGDGTTLAALDSFGVFLRDPATGDLLFEIAPGGIAFDVAFSPDDTMIAYTSSQGLWVYEVATGTELYSFQEARDWMSNVTWSPDQTMIAASADDHTVRVFTVGE